MKSDAVYHGLNFDVESDEFVRCARCGFPCKLERDVQAPDGSRIGWGITNTSYPVCATTYDQDITYEPGTEAYDTDIIYDRNDANYDTGANSSGYITYDGVAKTIYDPIVTSGCPQCGTLRYNK